MSSLEGREAGKGENDPGGNDSVVGRANSVWVDDTIVRVDRRLDRRLDRSMSDGWDRCEENRRGEGGRGPDCGRIWRILGGEEEEEVKTDEMNRPRG